MTTLLRIDASIRSEGSHSRELADHYQQVWQADFPAGEVIVRDLALEPIPHVNGELVEAFYARDNHDPRLELADQLLDEVQRADELLISSPLYNLSLPSSLKAYFDHLSRPGLTFNMVEGQYQGLLNGKHAVLITTRGSLSNPMVKDDFQGDYIRAMLNLLGIPVWDHIDVEGMSLPQPKRSLRLKLAKANIDYLLGQKLAAA